MYPMPVGCSGLITIGAPGEGAWVVEMGLAWWVQARRMALLGKPGVIPMLVSTAETMAEALVSSAQARRVLAWKAIAKTAPAWLVSATRLGRAFSRGCACYWE